MINNLLMQADISISPKTRFVEGMYNGIKFGIVHSLVFAPFMAKQASIELNLSYPSLYVRHCAKAFGFYSGVLGATFGLRQLVIQNKDTILFEL